MRFSTEKIHRMHARVTCVAQQLKMQFTQMSVRRESRHATGGRKEMAKGQQTQSEIQRALVESDDENIFVRECDSDDDNFAVDSCSDSESNMTEPASENDDEEL
ncbi:hypothetical protein EVAR_14254_1 [Eumeta japonica]|uniref:Uncharacterized protein n=1 Tax=Eumeta variegata TaxID=151549 RepID=A0A4C1W9K8_EUMVA|nr:hypothetical protein EVAR_14254_1 [Eumeta japonica]